MGDYVSVAKLSDLAEDSGHTVEVRGRLIALFRQGEEVHAIDDSCPHMGGPLGSGSVCDGVVMCPWHGWRFRISDGAWVDAPGSGVKLQCYPVKVEGEQVLLKID